MAKDPERAAQLFAKACDMGSALGCARLGQQLLRGEGVAKDSPRGVELLDRGCKEDIYFACGELALTLADGWGVPKDLPRAEKVFQKACEMGTRFSCVDLGRVLGRADEETRRKSLERYHGRCEHGGTIASSQYCIVADALACGLGDAEACVRHGLLLLVYQQDKDGEAAAALDKACGAGQAMGCLSLARQLLESDPSSAEAAAAAGHLRKACNGGSGPGCRELGYLFFTGSGVERNVGGAAQILEYVCSAGDPISCRALGDLVAREGLVEADRERVLPHLLQTCGEDRPCQAAVRAGKIPGAWEGSLEALPPPSLRTPCKDTDLKVLRRGRLRFPREALGRGLSGQVDVMYLVDHQGRPREVTVLFGPKLLWASAVVWAGQGRFEPPVVKGAQRALRTVATIKLRSD